VLESSSFDSFLLTSSAIEVAPSPFLRKRASVTSISTQKQNGVDRGVVICQTKSEDKLDSLACTWRQQVSQRGRRVTVQFGAMK
jgi:hypothetical protein